jgi:hypothetical protein
LQLEQVRLELIHSSKYGLSSTTYGSSRSVSSKYGSSRSGSSKYDSSRYYSSKYGWSSSKFDESIFDVSNIDRIDTRYINQNESTDETLLVHASINVHD